ncbi:hypothetical protein DC20_16020 [Rufibacter tibetensis]|uniref:Uncharacterized protein n=1 Tax=Rufibacter tibetensis TaxID=512763 RepID=A0A0P0C4U3_9BACT|nr:hypothetical protein DC20_16020 [Rufibacter tibetensis]
MGNEKNINRWLLLVLRQLDAGSLYGTATLWLAFARYAEVFPPYPHAWPSGKYGWPNDPVRSGFKAFAVHRYFFQYSGSNGIAVKELPGRV